MDSDAVVAKVKAIGQGAVLRFGASERLVKQLAALDLDSIPQLVSQYVTGRYVPPIPTRFDPARPMPRVPGNAEQEALYAKARACGEELLRAGRVGAFLVAGGQGTRLGYEGPKGEYPVTPIRNKPLFEVFAQQLLAAGRKFGRAIPWYLMTSETNDAATRAFFARHNHFGYDPANLFIFQQGMMPAFAMDGQLLLETKDSLALSPGGNGDCFRSMRRTGALADMQQRGLVQLSYFNIDNPLVHCIDPLFIGLNDVTGSDMGSKAVPKASATERVGNFAIADGKLQVIEYSDMPADVAAQTNADGSLKYASASIGIHVIRVDFVERLTAGADLQLPWHRAEKKVPCVDQAGNPVKPETPNAVKLEQFVFDAIPLGRNPLVYMTERAEEFSPVKNAEGNDSPATCRRDQIRRAARWLEAAGVQVERNANGEPAATIEISPLFAATAEELKGLVTHKSIAGKDVLYFE